MSASSPAGDGELVSVTVFRLARRYRPSLWPEVLPELDRVARMLADELHGTTGAGRTETVAGRRVRAYDIEYERSGSAFVERIVFVLEGRREYQLLCRFPAGRPVQGERSCAAFARSFGLE